MKRIKSLIRLVVIWILVKKCVSIECETCQGLNCMEITIPKQKCKSDYPLLPFKFDIVPRNSNGRKEYGCLDLQYYKGKIVYAVKQCMPVLQGECICKLFKYEVRIKQCSFYGRNQRNHNRGTYDQTQFCGFIQESNEYSEDSDDQVDDDDDDDDDEDNDDYDDGVRDGDDDDDDDDNDDKDSDTVGRKADKLMNDNDQGKQLYNETKTAITRQPSFQDPINKTLAGSSSNNALSSEADTKQMFGSSSVKPNTPNKNNNQQNITTNFTKSDMLGSLDKARNTISNIETRTTFTAPATDVKNKTSYSINVKSTIDTSSKSREFAKITEETKTASTTSGGTSSYNSTLPTPKEPPPIIKDGQNFTIHNSVTTNSYSSHITKEDATIIGRDRSTNSSKDRTHMSSSTTKIFDFKEKTSQLGYINSSKITEFPIIENLEYTQVELPFKINDSAPQDKNTKSTVNTVHVESNSPKINMDSQLAPSSFTESSIINSVPSAYKTATIIEDDRLTTEIYAHEKGQSVNERSIVSDMKTSTVLSPHFSTLTVTKRNVRSNSINSKISSYDTTKASKEFSTNFGKHDLGYVQNLRLTLAADMSITIINGTSNIERSDGSADSNGNITIANINHGATSDPKLAAKITFDETTAYLARNGTHAYNSKTSLSINSNTTNPANFNISYSLDYDDVPSHTTPANTYTIINRASNFGRSDGSADSNGNITIANINHGATSDPKIAAKITFDETTAYLAHNGTHAYNSKTSLRSNGTNPANFNISYSLGYDDVPSHTTPANTYSIINRTSNFGRSDGSEDSNGNITIANINHGATSDPKIAAKITFDETTAYLAHNGTHAYNSKNSLSINSNDTNPANFNISYSLGYDDVPSHTTPANTYTIINRTSNFGRSDGSEDSNGNITIANINHRATSDPKIAAKITFDETTAYLAHNGTHAYNSRTSLSINSNSTNPANFNISYSLGYDDVPSHTTPANTYTIINRTSNFGRSDGSVDSNGNITIANINHGATSDPKIVAKMTFDETTAYLAHNGTHAYNSKNSLSINSNDTNPANFNISYSLGYDDVPSHTTPANTYTIINRTSNFGRSDGSEDSNGNITIANINHGATSDPKIAAKITFDETTAYLAHNGTHAYNSRTSLSINSNSTNPANFNISYSLGYDDVPSHTTPANTYTIINRTSNFGRSDGSADSNGNITIANINHGATSDPKIAAKITFDETTAYLAHNGTHAYNSKTSLSINSNSTNPANFNISYSLGYDDVPSHTTPANTYTIINRTSNFGRSDGSADSNGNITIANINHGANSDPKIVAKMTFDETTAYLAHNGTHAYNSKSSLSINGNSTNPANFNISYSLGYDDVPSHTTPANTYTIINRTSNFGRSDGSADSNGNITIANINHGANSDPKIVAKMTFDETTAYLAHNGTHAYNSKTSLSINSNGTNPANFNISYSLGYDDVPRHTTPANTYVFAESASQITKVNIDHNTTTESESLFHILGLDTGTSNFNITVNNITNWSDMTIASISRTPHEETEKFVLEKPVTDPEDKINESSVSTTKVFTSILSSVIFNSLDKKATNSEHADIFTENGLKVTDASFRSASDIGIKATDDHLATEMSAKSEVTELALEQKNDPLADSVDLQKTNDSETTNEIVIRQPNIQDSRNVSDSFVEAISATSTNAYQTEYFQKTHSTNAKSLTEGLKISPNFLLQTSLEENPNILTALAGEESLSSSSLDIIGTAELRPKTTPPDPLDANYVSDEVSPTSGKANEIGTLMRSTQKLPSEVYKKDVQRTSQDEIYFTGSISKAMQEEITPETVDRNEMLPETNSETFIDNLKNDIASNLKIDHNTSYTNNEKNGNYPNINITAGYIENVTRETYMTKDVKSPFDIKQIEISSMSDVIDNNESKNVILSDDYASRGTTAEIKQIIFDSKNNSVRNNDNIQSANNLIPNESTITVTSSLNKATPQEKDEYILSNSNPFLDKYFQETHTTNGGLFLDTTERGDKSLTQSLFEETQKETIALAAEKSLGNPNQSSKSNGYQQTQSTAKSDVIWPSYQRTKADFHQGSSISEITAYSTTFESAFETITEGVSYNFRETAESQHIGTSESRLENVIPASKHTIPVELLTTTGDDDGKDSTIGSGLVKTVQEKSDLYKPTVIEMISEDYVRKTRETPEAITGGPRKISSSIYEAISNSREKEVITSLNSNIPTDISSSQISLDSENFIGNTVNSPKTTFGSMDETTQLDIRQKEISKMPDIVNKPRFVDPISTTLIDKVISKNEIITDNNLSTETHAENKVTQPYTTNVYDFLFQEAYQEIPNQRLTSTKSTPFSVSGTTDNSIVYQTAAISNLRWTSALIPDTTHADKSSPSNTIKAAIAEDPYKIRDMTKIGPLSTPEFRLENFKSTSKLIESQLLDSSIGDGNIEKPVSAFGLVLGNTVQERTDSNGRTIVTPTIAFNSKPKISFSSPNEFVGMASSSYLQENILLQKIALDKVVTEPVNLFSSEDEISESSLSTSLSKIALDKLVTEPVNLFSSEDEISESSLSTLEQNILLESFVLEKPVTDLEDKINESSVSTTFNSLDKKATSSEHVDIIAENGLKVTGASFRSTTDIDIKATDDLLATEISTKSEVIELALELKSNLLADSVDLQKTNEPVLSKSTITDFGGISSLFSEVTLGTSNTSFEMLKTDPQDVIEKVPFPIEAIETGTVNTSESQIERFTFAPKQIVFQESHTTKKYGNTKEPSSRSSLLVEKTDDSNNRSLVGAITYNPKHKINSRDTTYSADMEFSRTDESLQKNRIVQTFNTRDVVPVSEFNSIQYTTEGSTNISSSIFESGANLVDQKTVSLAETGPHFDIGKNMTSADGSVTGINSVTKYIGDLDIRQAETSMSDSKNDTNNNVPKGQLNADEDLYEELFADNENMKATIGPKNHFSTNSVDTESAKEPTLGQSVNADSETSSKYMYTLIANNSSSKKHFENEYSISGGLVSERVESVSELLKTTIVPVRGESLSDSSELSKSKFYQAPQTIRSDAATQDTPDATSTQIISNETSSIGNKSTTSPRSESSLVLEKTVQEIAYSDDMSFTKMSTSTSNMKLDKNSRGTTYSAEIEFLDTGSFLLENKIAEILKYPVNGLVSTSSLMHDIQSNNEVITEPTDFIAVGPRNISVYETVFNSLDKGSTSSLVSDIFAETSSELFIGNFTDSIPSKSENLNDTLMVDIEKDNIYSGIDTGTNNKTNITRTTEASNNARIPLDITQTETSSMFDLEGKKHFIDLISTAVLNNITAEEAINTGYNLTTNTVTESRVTKVDESVATDPEGISSAVSKTVLKNNSFSDDRVNSTSPLGITQTEIYSLQDVEVNQLNIISIYSATTGLVTIKEVGEQIFNFPEKTNDLGIKANNKSALNKSTKQVPENVSMSKDMYTSSLPLENPSRETNTTSRTLLINRPGEISGTSKSLTETGAQVTPESGSITTHISFSNSPALLPEQDSQKIINLAGQPIMLTNTSNLLQERTNTTNALFITEPAINSQGLTNTSNLLQERTNTTNALFITEPAINSPRNSTIKVNGSSTGTRAPVASVAQLNPLPQISVGLDDSIELSTPNSRFQTSSKQTVSTPTKIVFETSLVTNPVETVRSSPVSILPLADQASTGPHVHTTVINKIFGIPTGINLAGNTKQNKTEDASNSETTKETTSKKITVGANPSSLFYDTSSQKTVSTTTLYTVIDQDSNARYKLDDDYDDYEMLNLSCQAKPLILIIILSVILCIGGGM